MYFNIPWVQLNLDPQDFFSPFENKEGRNAFLKAKRSSGYEIGTDIPIKKGRS